MKNDDEGIGLKDMEKLGVYDVEIGTNNLFVHRTLDVFERLFKGEVLDSGDKSALVNLYQSMRNSIGLDAPIQQFLTDYMFKP